MLILLHFVDLVGLVLWRTVVVNDSNASTQLKQFGQFISLFNVNNDLIGLMNYKCKLSVTHLHFNLQDQINLLRMDT